MIHYDLPRRIDDYVHRTGRTGRFGRSGVSVGFANAAQRGVSAELLRSLVEAGTQPPAWLLGATVGEWGRVKSAPSETRNSWDWIGCSSMFIHVHPSKIDNNRF